MSDNKKNWYEHSTYLQRIYEETEELTPYPSKWNELYEWFNRIDNDIQTTDLISLIHQIRINDIMCKNNTRNLLAEKGILPKRAFDELWDQYRVTVVKYEKEEEEEKGEEIPLLSIIVAEKPRGGIYKLLSTKGGIIYRQIKKYKIKNTDEFYEMNFDTPILDVPFDLTCLYLTQNEERFYEVKIGAEERCLSKSDLLDFIDNKRNYSYVTGKEYKNFISIILRGYEKKYNLEPISMFPTIGVFLTQNKELKIIYPGIKNIKLYGENDFQKEIISFCEKKGIDTNGDLTTPFYEIIHNNSLPLSVRLITSGYIAISPFFYALKDYLDIFPNLFWIAPPGTGKTTFFELMGNIIYGTELQNADDVNSQARLSKIPTSHTTPLPIDDMDELKEIQMSFIKSISTRKKGRIRMGGKDKQEILREEVYASFMGTANEDDFIQGEDNMAFRIRALTFRAFKRVDILKDKGFKKFDENIKEIKQGKIFGYYLLKNALEFIKKTDNLIENASYEKFTNFIDNIKERLIDYFLKKFGNEYIDPRRITIYSLILVGLYFWRYLFNKHKLNVDILSKVIDFEENNMFLQFIIDLEEIEQIYSLQDFGRIVDFYEDPKSAFKRYFNNKNDKEIVLGRDFINEYDKWAGVRRYEPLKHLTTIANMESRLLMRRIETGSERVIDQESETSFDKPIWGIIFYLNEIKEKMVYLDKIKKKMDYDEKIKREKGIIERIEKAFESNDFKGLEENALKQILGRKYNENLIEKAFDYLWDNEVIIPDETNDNLIYFKKENLLNLKLDGDGGDIEYGEP